MTFLYINAARNSTLIVQIKRGIKISVNNCRYIFLQYAIDFYNIINPTIDYIQTLHHVCHLYQIFLLNHCDCPYLNNKGDTKLPTKTQKTIDPMTAPPEIRPLNGFFAF